MCLCATNVYGQLSSDCAFLLYLCSDACMFFTGPSILLISEIPFSLYIFLKSMYKWVNEISFLYHIYILLVFMKERCKSDKNKLLFKFNTHANTNSFFLLRKTLHWFLDYIFLPLDVLSDSNKFSFIYHIYQWMKFYLLWLRTCF